MAKSISKQLLFQGRNQSRCQPTSGHSFGSLKNKYHTIKKKNLPEHSIYLNRTPLSIVSDSAPDYSMHAPTLLPRKLTIE
jgi:hypothetical protein